MINKTGFVDQFKIAKRYLKFLLLYLRKKIIFYDMDIRCIKDVFLNLRLLFFNCNTRILPVH